jgi:hypothetical protein
VSWAGIGFLWGRAFGPAGEPGRQAGPEPVATREGTA